MEEIINKRPFITYEEFLNSINNRIVIKWVFFHPFFYIMINQYKICAIKEGYLEKDKRNIISTLEVNKVESFISETEIMTIFYCYIDEVCGNFVFAIDENFFLTTSIELEKIIKEEVRECMKELKRSEMKFVCIVEAREITKDGRKINLKFSLWRAKKNFYKEENLKFICLLEGKAKFQKPKLSLPMSLSSKF